MVELINGIATVIGYMVIGVVVGTFISCGIDHRPVKGVTKLTFYDHGLVVINKRQIDSELLSNLYQAGYMIWDVRYPYAIGLSYVKWWGSKDGK